MHLNNNNNNNNNKVILLPINFIYIFSSENALMKYFYTLINTFIGLKKTNPKCLTFFKETEFAILENGKLVALE